MALDRIENLINKYFEGETSIAEEKELNVYFSSFDVAQHLKQYQPIFGYFSKASTEQFTAKIPLQTKRRNFVAWLSIAASVVVLLGVGTLIYLDSNKASQFVNCNSEDNPEKVMQETQKALALVSEKLNTGIESVSYINEYESTKNRIFKK
jgi:hypothetical protein